MTRSQRSFAARDTRLCNLAVASSRCRVASGRVGFDPQATGIDATAGDADAGDLNLLNNGSFETIENWPQGWLFQVIDPAAATLTRDTTTAYDGATSWQMFSVTFSPPDDTVLLSILFGIDVGDGWTTLA